MICSIPSLASNWTSIFCVYIFSTFIEPRFLLTSLESALSQWLFISKFFLPLSTTRRQLLFKTNARPVSTFVLSIFPLSLSHQVLILERFPTHTHTHTHTLSSLVKFVSAWARKTLYSSRQLCEMSIWIIFSRCLNAQKRVCVCRL